MTKNPHTDPQAPHAPAAQTVFFGIPLKARAVSKNWDWTVRDFNRTLASIYNQTNPNFRILVGCHDIPELLIPTDERLEFLQIKSTPPDLRADFKAIFPDKGRKLYRLAERFRDQEGSWFMTLDADDLISMHLVEFILSNPNPNGYITKQGYVLDQSSMKMALIPNKQIFETSFDILCGSCAIIRFNEPDLEQLKLNVSESRFGRYLNTDHTQGLGEIT